MSCYTWKGKTADGKHWQICYKKGDHVLSQGEADVAKCLTDLHVAQATTCIDTKDTKCEVEGGVTPDIKRAQIGGFAKDVKINADTGEVIKFALDEAVKEKLYFRKSKLDWLVLARTSDNGNGASLQKLTFFSHQASGC